MGRHFWLSVLFWFMSLSAVIGQADSSFVHFRAKLINANSGEAVPYAHVLLLSKHMGITSDDSGYFDTHLHESDSLLISSIGFEEFRFAVKDMHLDSSINIISLKPKVYMLDEVQITQYPSYEELVEAIVNPIYTENEKKIIRAQEHMKEADLEYVAGTRGTKGVGGPISAIYNLFSRDQKNKRKYERLVKDDHTQKCFNKKISIDLVKELTGLNDSILVRNFIEYCNFDDVFLKNSSEYELYTLILKKYKAFRRKD